MKTLTVVLLLVAGSISWAEGPAVGGRYVMFGNQYSPYLLDTQTGETWTMSNGIWEPQAYDCDHDHFSFDPHCHKPLYNKNLIKGPIPPPNEEGK